MKKYDDTNALNGQKLHVADLLLARGVELPAGPRKHIDVLEAAYRYFGKRLRIRNYSNSAIHGHYGKLLEMMKKADARSIVPISTDMANEFYASYEWRKLRYQILMRDKQQCLLCGASRERGAVLNVDHIKPLKRNWSLRLDPNNLQTLCDACNHGKGNWDQTDWREDAAFRRMREQLDAMTRRLSALSRSP